MVLCCSIPRALRVKQFVSHCVNTSRVPLALHIREFVTEVQTELKSPNWKICAAVCLARLPLVAPNPSDIEEEYFELLRQQEYEQSVYALWEVEQKRQTEIMNAVESGERDPQDIDFKATNQDIEDENETKLNEFAESKHDHLADDDDMKNISRKVRDSLVYIVKQKLGRDEIWLLPSLAIADHETVRQCAERALAAYKSDDFEGRIISNAPSSFYKFKFPKGVRLKSEEDGTKVFIYSAIAKRSESLTAERFGKPRPVEFTDGCSLDYAWVTAEEMKKLLKPKYFEAVREILY